MAEATQIKAKYMKAKISPKKVAPVMDLVRGKSLIIAKKILAFDRTKAASMIFKLIKSAEANAVNNNKLNPENLYVSEIYVSPGQISKSGMFSAKGRFSRILKRSSHLHVFLKERAKA